MQPENMQRWMTVSSGRLHYKLQFALFRRFLYCQDVHGSRLQVVKNTYLSVDRVCASSVCVWLNHTICYRQAASTRLRERETEREQKNDNLRAPVQTAAAAFIEWNGRKRIQILYTVANRNQVLMRVAISVSVSVLVGNFNMVDRRKEAVFFFAMRLKLADSLVTLIFILYSSFGSLLSLSTLGHTLDESTPIKFYYVTNYYLTASISSSAIRIQMRWEWNVTQTATDDYAFAARRSLNERKMVFRNWWI